MVTLLTVVLSIGFLFSVNLVFSNMMPHQQKRIKVALSIEDDPRDAGYNVNQSKIAIGSGGAVGKGFLKGTQTKLKYVPEQHTDFIFCTIGEEEGFLGTCAVVLLFLILILRIITLAERQPTVFGRVYAYCVASYLIFHFCINIGMVIGLCPVIGIPLPFFSYGGSSLWGFTFLLFILLRIDASRRSRHTMWPSTASAGIGYKLTPHLDFKAYSFLNRLIISNFALLCKVYATCIYLAFI